MTNGSTSSLRSRALRCRRSLFFSHRPSYSRLSLPFGVSAQSHFVAIGEQPCLLARLVAGLLSSPLDSNHPWRSSKRGRACRGNENGKYSAAHDIFLICTRMTAETSRSETNSYSDRLALFGALLPPRLCCCAAAAAPPTSSHFRFTLRLQCYDLCVLRVPAAAAARRQRCAAGTAAAASPRIREPSLLRSVTGWVCASTVHVRW